MSKMELLSSDKHATVRALAAERTVGPFVRVVLDEIVMAAASCPLLLSKHAETGAFYIGALMGFKERELLIERPDGKPSFIPMEWDREGFFAVDEHIALDRDCRRFAEDQGELLFDQNGQPTPSLTAAQRALGRLISASAGTDLFIAELVAHRLIEPIDISLSFDDGERLRLDGLYTVSLDAIADLDDLSSLRLLRAGHLQIAYAMTASLQHIALMSRRRNEQLVSV